MPCCEKLQVVFAYQRGSDPMAAALRSCCKCRRAVYINVYAFPPLALRVHFSTYINVYVFLLFYIECVRNWMCYFFFLLYTATFITCHHHIFKHNHTTHHRRKASCFEYNISQTIRTQNKKKQHFFYMGNKINAASSILLYL